MAVNTADQRKIPRGVDAALVVVVAGGGGGGGGGEAAATRLLGEFLTGDLRTLRIGPRAAKKWRGSSEGRWK
jgi:NAD(P)H-hydrate repair Nnr-like enzyme with NAD(P)H-hydrate epimerase domain